MGFTELHRHLDVSIRLTTLLELAQAQGLEAQSTSLEGFAEKIYLRAPLTDLSSVLARFQLFQKVLRSPPILTRVAREVIEDCANEGIEEVELRFSPAFVTEFSGLSWDDALLAFERGVQEGLTKQPKMKAGFLIIASRDFGPEAAERTIDFAIRHRNRILGVDLAGPEVGYPARIFAPAYRKAQAAGLCITIHAGEASGPEEIWAAIEELGAQRIGHGIAAHQDRQLQEKLKSEGICLEICPTSNWLTQCVPTLATHPLPQLLRAGVPVCINTDDPGVFPVTLESEREVARTEMGLSEAELAACSAFATQFSFFRKKEGCSPH